MTHPKAYITTSNRTQPALRIKRKRGAFINRANIPRLYVSIPRTHIWRSLLNIQNHLIIWWRCVGSLVCVHALRSFRAREALKAREYNKIRNITKSTRWQRDVCVMCWDRGRSQRVGIIRQSSCESRNVLIGKRFYLAAITKSLANAHVYVVYICKTNTDAYGFFFWEMFPIWLIAFKLNGMEIWGSRVGSF